MEWLWIALPILVALGAAAALRRAPVGLWLEAKRAGVPVTMAMLADIQARGVNPGHLVVPLVETKRAGLTVDPAEACAFLAAGGDLAAVSHALVLARRLDAPLGFQDVTRLASAGADLTLEVRRSALIGKVGRTASDAAPYGKATFKGELLDVRAKDGYVSQDRKIEIVDVDRDHVWVKEVEARPGKGKGGWKKL